jgi:hypothetical protein
MKDQEEAIRFSIRILEEYAPDSVHIQTLEKMLTPQLDIQDWYMEWISLWPTKAQVEADSGKVWSYAPKVTGPTGLQRMKKFIKQFNKYCPTHKRLSLDEQLDKIFQATVEYLEERKRNNWEFTKKSIKFIDDNNGSTLASYIEGDKKVRKSAFDYSI